METFLVFKWYMHLTKTQQNNHLTIISMQVLTSYRIKPEHFRKRRLNCSSQSIVKKQANGNQYSSFKCLSSWITTECMCSFPFKFEMYQLRIDIWSSSAERKLTLKNSSTASPFLTLLGLASVLYKKRKLCQILVFMKCFFSGQSHYLDTTSNWQVIGEFFFQPFYLSTRIHSQNP